MRIPCDKVHSGSHFAHQLHCSGPLYTPPPTLQCPTARIGTTQSTLRHLSQDWIVSISYYSHFLFCSRTSTGICTSKSPLPGSVLIYIVLPSIPTHSALISLGWELHNFHQCFSVEIVTSAFILLRCPYLRTFSVQIGTNITPWFPSVLLFLVWRFSYSFCTMCLPFQCCPTSRGTYLSPSAHLICALSSFSSILHSFKTICVNFFLT